MNRDTERIWINRERAVVVQIRALAEQEPNPRDYQNWDAFYRAQDDHEKNMLALETQRRKVVEECRAEHEFRSSP
jgi:hypothetical protein